MPNYIVTATVEIHVKADDEDKAKDIAIDSNLAVGAVILIGTEEVEEDKDAKV